MMEQAIIMGMPIDLFWNGDPTYYWRYCEAYKQKEERRSKEMNSFAWLQGSYIQRAIVAALDGKKNKYPAKPLENYVQEEMTVEQQQKEEAKLYKNLLNWSAGLKGKFSKDTKH